MGGFLFLFWAAALLLLALRLYFGSSTLELSTNFQYVVGRVHLDGAAATVDLVYVPEVVLFSWFSWKCLRSSWPEGKANV